MPDFRHIALLFLLFGLPLSNASAAGTPAQAGNDNAPGKYHDLPEVVVESHDKDVLHLLAYVREYSTLATFTDTVTLYREKWVDFMIPGTKVKRYDGWTMPRVLSSSSYYRFTNSEGLDSVSDRYNRHFSWGDVVGVIDRIPLSSQLLRSPVATDTVRGNFSIAETWKRQGEEVELNVNLLGNRSSHPELQKQRFLFGNETDFDRIDVKYNFDDVDSDLLHARDLQSISFEIESNARGRGMRLGRLMDGGRGSYITTKGEIYFADLEYLKVKEARQWENHSFIDDELGYIQLPDLVPQLDEETSLLITRVDGIDHNAVRMSLKVDGKFRPKWVEQKPMTRKQKILRTLKKLILG